MTHRGAHGASYPDQPPELPPRTRRRDRACSRRNCTSCMLCARRREWPPTGASTSTRTRENDPGGARGTADASAPANVAGPLRHRLLACACYCRDLHRGSAPFDAARMGPPEFGSYAEYEHQGPAGTRRTGCASGFWDRWARAPFGPRTPPGRRSRRRIALAQEGGPRSGSAGASRATRGRAQRGTGGGDPGTESAAEIAGAVLDRGPRAPTWEPPGRKGDRSAVTPRPYLSPTGVRESPSS